MKVVRMFCPWRAEFDDGRPRTRRQEEGESERAAVQADEDRRVADKVDLGFDGLRDRVNLGKSDFQLVLAFLAPPLRFLLRIAEPTFSSPASTDVLQARLEAFDEGGFVEDVARFTPGRPVIGLVRDLLPARGVPAFLD